MIPTWQSDRKQTKSTCQHQKYLLSENGHLGSLVSKFALGPVLAWIAPFLSLNRTTVLTSQSKNSITSGWVSCITSPPETLPLSHLAEGGGGAPEEGLTQDRKEYGRAGLRNVTASISTTDWSHRDRWSTRLPCSWAQPAPHSVASEESKQTVSDSTRYPIGPTCPLAVLTWSSSLSSGTVFPQGPRQYLQLSQI